jgi:hypothetical protein
MQLGSPVDTHAALLLLWRAAAAAQPRPLAANGALAATLLPHDLNVALCQGRGSSCSAGSQTGRVQVLLGLRSSLVVGE